MIAALAAALALTATPPPMVDLEVDVHGHPRAAGARATASALGHLELTGEVARAFGGGLAYAGEASAFLNAGPVKLGLEGEYGTSVQGRAFAELPAGATLVRLTLGYQHSGGTLLADGYDGVSGRALLGALRVESALGPVIAYGRLRAFRPLVVAAPVDPTTPTDTPVDCPTSPTYRDPNDVTGINTALNTALRSFQLSPGAGAKWRFSRGVALYGEVEWAPSGVLVSAGLSLSLEGLMPLPVVGAPPPPAKPEPKPAPPWIEIHLTAAGAPLQGVAVLTGPRRVQVPVGPDGVARVELEAGKWRAAFHAPGHLSRETAFVLEADAPVYAEADLRPAPAVRTVMLMKDEVRLLQPLHFLAGTPRLAPESAQVLDEVADIVVNQPERSVSVIAHTDPLPGVDAEALTQGEADAVVGYLRQRVAPDRLAGRGAGDREPLFPNLIAEARSRNRRVVFELH